MKYLLLLISLLNFNNQNSLKITYEIEILKNKDHEIPMEFRGDFEKINRATEDLVFELHSNGESSRFHLIEQMAIDNDRYNNSAIAAVGGKYIYFNNGVERIKSGDVYGRNTNIIEAENRFNEWEVSKDSKNILGYTCYKATTTYKSFDKNGEEMEVTVKAWFAPEIPVSTGPFNYSRLPGAILEFSKNPKYTFVAKEIELNPENLNLEKPAAEETINQEAFDEKVKKALEIIKARG